MTPQLLPANTPAEEPSDELRNGDRMSRAEFHELYLRAPKHFKAELIDGEVYVASPLKLPHGRNHFPIGAVLTAYENSTPGADSGDNVTVIFDNDNEPQPNAFLRVLPEYGGRSNTDPDDYIAGPPEFVVEIAASSRSIDLNRKRLNYGKHGVLEYLVLNVRDRKLHWFDLSADRELKADADGIYQVRVFPGLWINSSALFARDIRRLLATLDAGLATPEHAAFVAKLAATKKP